VPVEHIGNAAAATEEADEVRRLVGEVLADGQWTDAQGATRPLRPPRLRVPLQPPPADRRPVAGPRGGGGVCSPALLTPPVSRPENLRSVNALSQVHEQAAPAFRSV